MQPRRLALLCLLATLALAAHGRPRPAAASKDPQALQILAQYLTASGGMTAITSIQDSTETGTITYYWAGRDVQGSVTLRAKGLNEFRLDASLNDGTRTWALNQDGVGVLIAQDGKRTPLQLYNLMTAGSLSFPAGRIATAANDPSTTITYVGLVNSDAGNAYQIHVVPPVDATLAAAISGVGAFDLYIDPNSYHLLELAETVWSEANAKQTFSHEIIFSTYTSVNGLLVPYAISEKVGGQQTWSATISSVAFNTGLDDSIFSP